MGLKRYKGTYTSNTLTKNHTIPNTTENKPLEFSYIS